MVVLLQGGGDGGVGLEMLLVQMGQKEVWLGCHNSESGGGVVEPEKG